MRLCGLWLWSRLTDVVVVVVVVVGGEVRSRAERFLREAKTHGGATCIASAEQIGFARFPKRAVEIRHGALGNKNQMSGGERRSKKDYHTAQASVGAGGIDSQSERKRMGVERRDQNGGAMG